MSNNRSGFVYVNPTFSDSIDDTKKLDWDLSNITTSTTRTITIPDKTLTLGDFETDIFRISDDIDNTKKLAFDVSSLTTSTVRTITIPDRNLTLGDFEDDLFRISDNIDNTKKLAFELSNITTSTTRTITVPDTDVTLGAVETDNTISGDGTPTNVLSLENSHSGTTFPASPHDGFFFYRTDLQWWFVFDDTRSKWLGELETQGAGSNGNTTSGSYFNLFDGMVMSATQGILIPYDITITGITMKNNNTVTTDIIVRRNGTNISTLSVSSSDSDSDLTLNDNFAANGIFSVFNSGSTVNDTQIRIYYKRRAT